MFKFSKLSSFKIKKIIWHFCLDIDATRTSKLLGFNRKTINYHFHIFRKAIFDLEKICPLHSSQSLHIFTKRRLLKFNGVKINHELHMRESEWRFKKSAEELFEELSEILKKR
ncbi:MAG: hypothetical protein JNK65_00505 [Deltaproteobacteria bacterium]|nr:hypothetical protein [Deltaproteobacteria bacterium]